MTWMILGPKMKDTARDLTGSMKDTTGLVDPWTLDH